MPAGCDVSLIEPGRARLSPFELEEELEKQRRRIKQLEDNAITAAPASGVPDVSRLSLSVTELYSSDWDDPDSFNGTFSSEWAGLSPDGTEIAWWEFDATTGLNIDHMRADITGSTWSPTQTGGWASGEPDAALGWFALFEGWDAGETSYVIRTDTAGAGTYGDVQWLEATTGTSAQTYLWNDTGIGVSLAQYTASGGRAEGNWDPFKGVHRWGDAGFGSAIEFQTDGSRGFMASSRYGGVYNSGSLRFRIGPAAESGRFWAHNGSFTESGPVMAPHGGSLRPIPTSNAIGGTPDLGDGYIACTLPGDTGAIWVDQSGIGWLIGGGNNPRMARIGTISGLSSPSSYLYFRMQASATPGTCYLAHISNPSGDINRVTVIEIVASIT